MYKLICNSDPRALGIESEDGTWDLAKFSKHIHECSDCKDFTRKIVDTLLGELEGKRKCGGDSRSNSK